MYSIKFVNYHVEIKCQLDATDADLLHLVGILFPHNNDDARSKSLQIRYLSLCLFRMTVRISNYETPCTHEESDSLINV